MQTHHLKLDKFYWDAVVRGEKPFEVRRDDRGFQRGDTLFLHKYDMSNDNGRQCSYEGRYIRTCEGEEIRTNKEQEADLIRCKVTYVLTGGQFGIEPGYVVLGITMNI